MNYKKLLNSYFPNCLRFKSLIFLAALLFSFPSFALTDCANLASGTTPNPGVNCGYFGLPLCNTVVTPNPRINCADLIHLPLDIDLSDQGATVNLGKNAVTECKNITPLSNAVHNQNCIRFCDSPESGVTPNVGVNCVDRKCFQITSGKTPIESGTSKNCDITSCKYLTTYELNDPKFDDSTKKYCDGQLKCYEFEQSKLQFLKVRQDNTMCLLHQCKPISSECGADDTLNVSNKGAAYKLEYQNRILNGFTLESNTVCAAIVCRPVIYRKYYCNGASTNSNCDSACDDDYCTKKIDCNLTANSTQPECIDYALSSPDTIVDSLDSWFYRPAPLVKATTKKSGRLLAYYDDSATQTGANYYLPMEVRDAGVDDPVTNKICYTKENLMYNGAVATGNASYPNTCDENSCPSSENECKNGYCVKKDTNGEHWWGYIAGALGYFHSQYSPDQSRSPGLCDSSRMANAGKGGYLYLCGTHYSLYGTPKDPAFANLEDFTAYYRGYVRSDFVKSDPEHKVNICVRYKNLLAYDDFTNTQACGARECAIPCAFSNCSNQYCGEDYCFDLTIKDSEGDKCKMDDTLFYDGSESDYKCMRKLGPYTRVRAVKALDSICTFIDTTGVFGGYAYDNIVEATKDANGNYNEDDCTNGSYLVDMTDSQGNIVYDDSGNAKKGCKFKFYFNYLGGNETFDDGSCVSGEKNSDGICEGFDTNKDSLSLNAWRTSKLKNYKSYESDNRTLNYDEVNGSKVGIELSPVVPYVSRDYYDLSGRLFEKRQCAKIPLRVDSFRLYNLANNSNSPKLFVPPLIIANARVKEDGAISLPEDNAKFGTTDFHNPAIEIRFGSNSKLLSLDALSNESSPVTINTTVAGLNYSMSVYIKKEYNSYTKKPILCLYRNAEDSQGNPLSPIKVDCVQRKYPEIDSKRSSASTGDIRAVIIAANSDLKYNNFEISLRYLISAGANNLNNSCSGDDVCSSNITLTASADSTTCQQSVEQYKICAKREECSKLNIECIENKKNLYNALNGNPNPNAGSITELNSIDKNCNEVLLPFCNAKKGFVSSADDFVSQDHNNSSSGNYYGWFNELCFVEGFETKLRKVYAYDLNGVRGKCFIDPTSPYLTDNNSSTNCDEGGKAPNCLCLEAPLNADVELNSGEIIRSETPREAGLCIDIPLPTVCKAIDYNTISEENEFVASSIANSIVNYPTQTYNDSSGVHTTHRNRTQDVLSSGHAEFSNAIEGMTNIAGQCKGFWRYDTDSSTGVSKSPLADCVNDGSGTVKWTNFENSCIRYSCSAVTTGNPYDNGNYPNNYDADDRDEADLEKRGETHGYATWPSLTKTDDFLQVANATSCITGFKKIGSTATVNSSGVITGYSGGTNPSRLCNQVGFWLPPINACERISCPAINPSIPSSSTDYASWAEWQDSGGATFPQVNASRDDSQILSSAISIGSCEDELGFFQTSGGQPPKRSCDHLGNWGPVQNPCVTECNAITADLAENDSNSGYATWSKITVTSAQYGQTINGVFGSCIEGYKINPYLGNPQRQCLPKAIPNQTGKYSYVWGVASKSCINQCQGGAIDSVNGKTTHATSSGNITITWPNADFGEYVYFSNRDMTTLNAGDFAENRVNASYLMRRKCNDDGTWSAPEIMCATNNGIIDNARYGSGASTSAAAEGIIVGGATSGGECNEGFVPDSDNSANIPVRQCQYKDSNKRIDQVFLNHVSGNLCVRNCSIAAGDKADHSRLASAATIRAGQQVALTCRSDSCGNNTNARVVCNSDGTQTAFDGSCRTCNGCTAASSIVPETPAQWNFNGACDRRHNFTQGDFTQFLGNENHGGEISACIYSYDRTSDPGCGTTSTCHFMRVSATFTCNDGSWTRVETFAETDCKGKQSLLSAANSNCEDEGDRGGKFIQRN